MNRKELVKTLELVKPALAANNMVPIFQCFTFTPESVAAYDDSLAIVGPTEAQGTFGLHGATLLGLLSNSSDEEVVFIDNKTDITIKCGKTISKLPYQTADSFIFEEPKIEDGWSLPINSSLIEAFKICLDTVSKDETQPALRGITIDKNMLYSCNGDTLTRIQIKGNKQRAFTATGFCAAVIKLWDSLSMAAGVLNFGNEWISADLDEWAVYGRVLAIKEPIDFEALIKNNIKKKVPLQVLPEGFKEALSRARVLADAESQRTTIEISKGKMLLFTETNTMGEIKDELTFEGHPDVIAQVSASHLQQALVYCDQAAFHDNCVVFEKAPHIFQLVSNM
jgi:DNA polymerase III sliding clamp (beta) subunit (PCNA family)